MKITRDWQSEADRIQANNSIPLLNFSIKEAVKERSLFVSSIPNNPLYRMFIANGTKFMKNIVSPLHRSPIILRVNQHMANIASSLMTNKGEIRREWTLIFVKNFFQKVYLLFYLLFQLKIFHPIYRLSFDIKLQSAYCFQVKLKKMARGVYKFLIHIVILDTT